MGVTRARLRCLGTTWLGLLVSLSPGVWSAELDELWWVVLGSYRNAELAERRQTDLEERLADVLGVVRTERGGAPLFRIVAGPFTDLGSARREVAEAASAGIADAWVTRLGDGRYESTMPDYDALPPLSSSGDLERDLDDEDADSTASGVPLDFNEDQETGFNRLFREGMR